MPTGPDLLVIGGGLTGLVAAWHALDLGLRVTVVAQSPGSLPYCSGALDLLGVYPAESKSLCHHPWQAIETLIAEQPTHPYARVGAERTRTAWTSWLEHLARGPLGYGVADGVDAAACGNQLLVTAAGTLKPTYALPASMTANSRAWAERAPTLLVGIDGLVDFAPEQVATNLGPRWPGLRVERLAVDDLLPEGRRVTAAELAAEMERASFRSALCERLKPKVGDARFVGWPAVLGLDGVTAVCTDLAQRLGVPVFEIPLLSPSIPGIRLSQLLERDLVDRGASLLYGASITAVARSGRMATGATRATDTGPSLIDARAILLATGRFFGGGLEATQTAIRETVLGLPIDAPASRDDWHMTTFLGVPGHPINRVGVQVDDQFRPVDTSGRAVLENVFAAGALLAHHDWVREKSGAGVCVATACAAVDAMAALLEGANDA